MTRDGSVYPFNFGPGLGYDNSMTNSASFLEYGDDANVSPDSNMPSPQTQDTPAKVSTLWYLFAVILIIVAFKWAVEHEKSGMQFSFLGISVYNFMAVGSLAFLWIVVMKTIFNKYPVKGLTDLINVA